MRANFLFMSFLEEFMNGDLCGDFGPELGIANRHRRLLGIPVNMDVEHEPTERSSEVKGQALIRHTRKDQVYRQLCGDLVDGQILVVQAHSCEEV